ncbi:MAG: Ig-like domain-containing protein, partial [Candidatus Desantisbacteria bacterium]
ANGAHIAGMQTIRMVAPHDTYRVTVQVHREVDDPNWWFSPIDSSLAGTIYEDGTPTDGWSAPWDTAMFTGNPGDGTYTVKVIAYGTGGTMLGSSTNTVIEVDNTINVPGMLAITTPTRGVLSGTVSVDEDVTEVTFEYLRNGTYTIGIDTASPFSYSWNTYSILDGTYSIRVTAKDEVGNASSTVTNAFKVDNTAPIATITSVAGSLPGTKVISGSVPVVYTATDTVTSVAARNISIDGGTWTGIPAGTYTWNTTALPDGAHTLQIQVIDTVGNVGYSSLRTIEVNNTQAGVVILEPANNAHIRGTQTIRVEAPASTYEVLMMVGTDGTTWYDPTTGATGSVSDTTPTDGWTAFWNTAVFTDGTWSVKAIAYGTGGTMLGSSTNTDIEVDNNVSILFVPAITTPTRGVIAGTVSVDEDVTEVTFEYLRNGTYTIGIDTASPFSYSWNT